MQALSKGMQQKVQLCTALIGSPRLMILDEPFSGPRSRQRAAARGDPARAPRERRHGGAVDPPDEQGRRAVRPRADDPPRANGAVRLRSRDPTPACRPRDPGAPNGVPEGVPGVHSIETVNGDIKLVLEPQATTSAVLRALLAARRRGRIVLASPSCRSRTCSSKSCARLDIEHEPCRRGRVRDDRGCAMNFRLVLTIARREYKTTVRRKAFLFTAIGTPLYFAVVMFISIGPGVKDGSRRSRSSRRSASSIRRGSTRTLRREIQTELALEAPQIGPPMPSQIVRTEVQFYPDPAGGGEGAARRHGQPGARDPRRLSRARKAPPLRACVESVLEPPTGARSRRWLVQGMLGRDLELAPRVARIARPTIGMDLYSIDRNGDIRAQGRQARGDGLHAAVRVRDAARPEHHGGRPVPAAGRRRGEGVAHPRSRCCAT